MTEGPAPQVRPTRPRPKIRSLFIAAGLILFTWYSANQVGVEFSTFVDVWGSPIWAKFWPIPWDWVFNRQNVWDPLIETFQIAIIATLIGCILALPISSPCPG